MERRTRVVELVKPELIAIPMTRLRTAVDVAHGRILQAPPRFKSGGEAGFPLPSTGRGIEGEGWADQAAFPITSTWAFPTPHPGPLPVEERGRWQRVAVLRRCFKFHHGGTSKMCLQKGVVAEADCSAL